MSTEIIVAVVAAGGPLGGGGIAGIAAYFTRRYELTAIEHKSDAAYLAARDERLWEQAERIKEEVEKFWSERAKVVEDDLALERTARKAGETALSADVAQLKNDNLKLIQAHEICQKKLEAYGIRLKRAGADLQAEEE